MNLVKSFIFLLFFWAILPVSAEEGFPGRQKFPDVSYITMEDFYKGYKKSKYMVVDVRSKFEYDLIKIVNSVNIPVADDDFEANIQALAAKTSKPIIFYCNGRRCMKSFEAVVKSKLSNTIAYDAGIFEWAKAYPEEAELWGESPIDPNKLISSKKLKQHFVPLKKFEQMIPDAVLIDVRDKTQRRGNGLFLLADKSAPLDKTRKLERYLNKALSEDKILLAYDQGGKTVRWLQYQLEKKGIKNYYFMEGGAKYYNYTGTN